MLIYLIGMMLSGKTTVGKQLSRRLSYEFMDTDEIIEKIEQRPIKDIILDDGIDYFRELENNVLINLETDVNTIIATGGGIVLNEENVRTMQSRGVVVYLEVPFTVLEKRLSDGERRKRPLLSQEKALTTIFEQRKPLYLNCAEIIIHTEGLTIEQIVQKIIESLV